MEGLFYQMHNFENKYQIRVGGKNLKVNFSIGLGDFFNQIFPFLTYQSGDWKMTLIPQIKVLRPENNSFTVLLVTEIQKLNRDGRDFKELSAWVKKVDPKNVRIFAFADSPDDVGEINEAIALIRELGVDYKEKKSHHAGHEDIVQKQIDVQLEDTVGEDAARILTKIAFNYFAKCAIESERRDLLSHPNFQQIKDYVLGRITLPTKKVIVDIAHETDIYDEVVAGGRIPGHRISFVEQDGKLVSRISLIGKRTYIIHLGELPEEYRCENFGSAHFFDPIRHNVLGMTQNPAKWNSGIKIGFSIFNRI
ncbi:hypothetical protein A2348_00125 [Candidatus Uhrbacteria bacterium RIFOXYB12_FULL_58_10]|uniref:Uncharacterized protein n=1 Tax=Candidatus Uhrbacteria bacterium RIFOXYB2_FULL_57_15 TaxID=1802422 RepID=A0A1F7W749_9BACT|nr:MAG: hypothetical protein A2348_00125 [Candidatus Uhrbacteria bacterium RIFOXYB12_FULL_58_10]OGL98635.1 MAG: hypothetical protein A2304_02935 [Candidatus Uhrbacteria bacterium RIFOXYB2_FULL_57_15]